MRVLGFRAHTVACIFGLLALVGPRSAAAETLSLMWDPSADATVSGYIVYVRMPGTQGNSYDVGKTTSFAWNGAVDGQQYYFSVASYSPGPVIGARSVEISRYPESAPTLANPGPQASTVGTAASLQLVGTDPDGGVLTYGAGGLPPGLLLTAATGRISGTPTTAGSFVVTASVSDGGSSTAQTFTWTVQASGSGTTTPPPTTSGGSSGTTLNTAPSLNNPGPQTGTQGAAVGLQLVASDPDGASVLTFGASGLPPGLQIERGNGNIYGSPTTPGNYSVTATVTDGALSDAKTFGWTILQPVIDSVAPVLTITLPTSAATYQTDQAFVTVGGTATDDGRVAEVAWWSDHGTSGKASGTDNWLAGIPVEAGNNIITIQARDEAGNTSTKSLTVKAKLAGSTAGPSVGVQKGKRTNTN